MRGINQPSFSCRCWSAFEVQSTNQAGPWSREQCSVGSRSIEANPSVPPAAAHPFSSRRGERFHRGREILARPDSAPYDVEAECGRCCLRASSSGLTFSRVGCGFPKSGGLNQFRQLDRSRTALVGFYSSTQQTISTFQSELDCRSPPGSVCAVSLLSHDIARK
jgi:hypothetical protein